MNRNVFLQIYSKLEKYPYFEQRRDAAQKLGMSTLMKFTVATQMLGRVLVADFMDEWLQVGESTSMLILNEFASFVPKTFSDKLLYPNLEQCHEIELAVRARGFLGCLDSIDCMHWYWDNCPKAYQGV